MQIPFQKYSGTGNDFIVIDNRNYNLPYADEKSKKRWEELCHRRFGIGADGILLLQNSQMPEADYRMVYLNSDGGEASMCGNGSRCLLHFAHHHLKIQKKGEAEHYAFQTKQGLYFGKISKDFVSIQMTELSDIQKFDLSSIEEFKGFLKTFNVNTGVPHCSLEVLDVDSLDIKKLGSLLRHHPLWGNQGSNINFYQIISPSNLKLRTYERGVEDETYACGTGALATALAYQFHSKKEKQKIKIQVKGGELMVDLTAFPQKIFLEGHVSNPYQGVFSWF